MSKANQYPIYLAAENKDYNIGINILTSGDSYTVFKDQNLLYNPITRTLKVNGIKFPQVEQTTVGLPKSAQTYLNTPFSQAIAGKTVVDITGLQASIKPSSVNSKILVVVRWFGEFNVFQSVYNSMWGLKRNGSPIGDSTNPGVRQYGMASTTSTYLHGADVDSTAEIVQYYYIDSPSTIETVTYQATLLPYDAITLYTNRTVNNTDSANYERGTSNIFLMELI